VSEIGNIFSLVAAAFGLLLFGVLYNWLVSWMEDRGYDEGYTALLVVIGSGVTLAVVALIDWRAALLAGGAFACSGLPMVIGGWWRHVRARRHAQDLLRSGDDTTAHLAE
jgi:hypothetical protein